MPGVNTGRDKRHAQALIRYQAFVGYQAFISHVRLLSRRLFGQRRSFEPGVYTVKYGT